MYFYFAQFYPEECGGYSVYFPDLPGCNTCGEDLNEAMDMAMDALTGYLDTSLEEEEEIPDASDYEKAKVKSLDAYGEMGIPPQERTLYMLVPANPGFNACESGENLPDEEVRHKQLIHPEKQGRVMVPAINDVKPATVRNIERICGVKLQ